LSRRAVSTTPTIVKQGAVREPKVMQAPIGELLRHRMRAIASLITISRGAAPGPAVLKPSAAA
jgi:hypothetical protein